MFIYAVSTVRAIGWVIGIGIFLSTALYLLVNVFRTGREEIGSEIELASNRKDYLSDEELEGRKLDSSLGMGLATLAVISLALPLYWLGEPGRHDGLIELSGNQFASRGSQSYEERCSACHGPGAVGGVASYTVTDNQGRFVAQSEWKAPSLTSVFSRFTLEEVNYVLNYGRQNSPMPAWGLAGGGPLNTQQIEELTAYLESIQLTEEEITAEVQAGIESQVEQMIRASVQAELMADDPALADDAAALNDAFMAQVGGDEGLAAAVTERLDGLSSVELGELVFNNPAAQGAYSCARCHTSGWSWNSDEVREAGDFVRAGLITPQEAGGGGFGPNLTNGATHRQFDTAQEQIDFISDGSENGTAYGNNGQGDGGGQMPGFGTNLTDEQLQAVVDYEREL